MAAAADWNTAMNASANSPCVAMAEIEEPAVMAADTCKRARALAVIDDVASMAAERASGIACEVAEMAADTPKLSFALPVRDELATMFAVAKRLGI